MPYSAPTSTGVFIAPNIDDLLIGFSKNLDEWAVNRYLKMQSVPKTIVRVKNVKSEQGSRNTSTNSWRWAPGADAPTGVGRNETYYYQLIETDRSAYPWTLPDLTIAQADHDIVHSESITSAMEAMTDRTMLTKAEMDAKLTSTAVTSPKWNTGTPASPVLGPALTAIAVGINKATQGKVTRKSLALVMNPTTASALAQSQEVTDLIKFTAGVSFARDGAYEGGFNLAHGCPDYFYGFEVIVESSTVISTPKKVADTSQVGNYIIPDGTVYVISKVGGLSGYANVGNFSTVTGYFLEGWEFTNEMYEDTINKRVNGRIVTNWVPFVSDQSKKSGAIYTGVI